MKCKALLQPLKVADSHGKFRVQDIPSIWNNWSGQTHGDNFRLFLKAFWIQKPLYFSLLFSNICGVAIKLISMTSEDHHAVSISLLAPATNTKWKQALRNGTLYAHVGRGYHWLSCNGYMLQWQCTFYVEMFMDGTSKVATTLRHDPCFLSPPAPN